MDQFKQIEAFTNAALRGSLAEAARLSHVTPAIIGRRIDALEQRLGVKLLLRSTRKLSLTQEGQAFLEDCQRVLADLSNAEASVSLGSIRARGHIKVSAPAGFGRRHVAPLVADYLTAHPETRVSLDLTDRMVDMINEGVDCAVRIGEMIDSNLVSTRLAEMRRVIVAAPRYLAEHGVPSAPTELAQHNCLVLGQQRGWSLRVGSFVQVMKVTGTLQCNDGAVLHEWALAGKGLAWRSLWEVGHDIATGRLQTVLDDFASPPVGIYAVFPDRRHLPLRVRLFIDLLKTCFGRQDYWIAPVTTT
jgi:DNA-binding transcriptional LysR family regulator